MRRHRRLQARIVSTIVSEFSRPVLSMAISVMVIKDVLIVISDGGPNWIDDDSNFHRVEGSIAKNRVTFK